MTDSTTWRASAIVVVLTLVLVAQAVPIDLAASPTSLNGPCLKFAGWSFCLRLDPDRAQGLELEKARFHGVSVLFSAGLPFVQTAYTYGEGRGYDVMKDSLGYDPSGNGDYGMVQRIAADECPHKLPHGLLWTPEGGLADSVCVEWDADHSPQEVSAWSRWNLGNYRFRQGYTMRDDGTLLPFLELGGQLFDYWDGTGTQPPWTACTTQPSGGGTSACRSHFHTAYWRFDFDVDTALGNQAEAFTWTDVEATNQDGAIPPCSPETSASWCAWPTETHADRNLPGFTKWRITNPTSKNSFGNPRSVELQPLGEGGPTDTSTHDVRAVAYKCHATLPQCEMGYEVRNGGRTDDTALDAYANGESLSPGDVVLWYAQRVHHEVRDEDIPHMVTHALGPVISTRNLVAGNPTN